MSYAYFHRDGKGAWHGYDAKTNAAIEAARPLEATLTLRYPDNPEKYRTFEIRFGAKAVSRRLKSPPSSGIIQVNVADENTRRRRRRRRAALPRAAPVAAAQNRADDAAARHSGSKMDAASLVAALEEAATLSSKSLVGTYVQVSKWGGGAKDGDAVVLDEVGKGSFFSSSPTASHRLRFAGGAEADALLRCREHATACATAPLAQPFRLLREPPAWALDEAAARAAEDREHWRARCGGAPEQLELTVFAAEGLSGAGVESRDLRCKIYAQIHYKGLGGGKHRKASVRASKRGGDCEAFGKKKLIAGLEIPVDILEPNVDTTGWLPMQKGGGKIQLRLRWLRAGLAAPATATAAAAPAVVTGGPVAAPPPPPPPVAVPPPPSGAPVVDAAATPPPPTPPAASFDLPPSPPTPTPPEPAKPARPPGWKPPPPPRRDKKPDAAGDAPPAAQRSASDADDRVLAPPPPPAGGLGLMGAIAARLAERRGSIAMTPMDESDSDSDGDWD
ncbi:hypothetical protein JL720_3142 [Aureococcus anophagefferens]|nr:hypothetical protein JL720_3142 [Aureococcus anophagefferens]